MPRTPHRLEHLIEDVNDAIYTVDLVTKTFTSINKAGMMLTGYSQQELIGAPITKIISRASLPLVQRKIQQKLQTKKPTVYEIEIMNKSGKTVPIEISSRILFVGDRPVEILGIARNITERKQADRQKEIFFSLITHEIKNPLTAIATYTSLLKKAAKQRKDEKGLKLTGQLESQVDAISELLSDFIDVNQLQLGKFSIVKEPFTLPALVEDIVGSYRKNRTGHTLEVTGKITRLLLADRHRVAQVLHNLIGNAIKYSPPGKKVGIHLSQTTSTIIIGVHDEGVGIPKQEQKAVFDLFYRVKNGTVEATGHGLGLYICREIMRGHKGKIWVESEVGKGSTFFVSFPLSR